MNSLCALFLYIQKTKKLDWNANWLIRSPLYISRCFFFSHSLACFFSFLSFRFQCGVCKFLHWTKTIVSKWQLKCLPRSTAASRWKNFQIVLKPQRMRQKLCERKKQSNTKFIQCIRFIYAMKSIATEHHQCERHITFQMNEPNW